MGGHRVRWFFLLVSGWCISFGQEGFQQTFTERQCWHGEGLQQQGKKERRKIRGILVTSEMGLGDLLGTERWVNNDGPGVVVRDSIISTLEAEARQPYAPSQPELYRETVSDELNRTNKPYHSSKWCIILKMHAPILQNLFKSQYILVMRNSLK